MILLRVELSHHGVKRLKILLLSNASRLAYACQECSRFINSTLLQETMLMHFIYFRIHEDIVCFLRYFFVLYSHCCKRMSTVHKHSVSCRLVDIYVYTFSCVCYWNRPTFALWLLAAAELVRILIIIIDWLVIYLRGWPIFWFFFYCICT